MEISSLPEDINVKTREASQNTNLDMRDFLGIDKALWTIQSEMLNITSKLMEIDECIKRLQKKMKELHDDPPYSEDQRQLYRDIKLEQWTTRKTWHTIKKQKSIYLGTRICIFFHEQGTTIILALAALSVTI